METTKSCVLAFVVTVVVLQSLATIAPRLGLVDKPGGRKQHEVPTPVVGGLAMFCGFILSALTLEIPLSGFWSFLAGATVLVLVGVFDDMRALGPKVKLLWQIAACLIMTLWGGVVLADLGALSGESLTLGTFALPFTVFAGVGVINALNMIDGVDGLAGSLSMVALIPLAILAALAGQMATCNVLLLLISVAAAFLSFNLHLWFNLHMCWCRYKTVFMGDAGSMFLGFTLAWFLMDLSQGPHQAIAPVTALWLFAVPLSDTISLMLHRAVKGRSPFSADREHLHHILQRAGLSAGQSVLAMCSAALVCAAIGIAGQIIKIPEWVMFEGFLTMFGVYFLAMTHVWNTLETQPIYRNRAA